MRGRTIELRAPRALKLRRPRVQLSRAARARARQGGRAAGLRAAMGGYGTTSYGATVLRPTLNPPNGELVQKRCGTVVSTFAYSLTRSTRAQGIEHELNRIDSSCHGRLIGAVSADLGDRIDPYYLIR